MQIWQGISLHLEDTMILYGIYDAEAMEKIV